MLDPTTMALLAKIKVSAKKSGINLDLVKMSEDKEYAELTLKNLSNSDDPELVLNVIQLMNLFGLIKAPPLEAKIEEKSDAGRYIGSLR